MSDLEKKLLEEQLDWFQVQRHDFLNNFQVIRGYLQLGMAEKAIEYMDEIDKEIEPQQKIYRIAHKTLRALLLGWFFEFRLKGIGIKITIPEEMTNTAFGAEHWQEEYGERFYGYTKACLEEVPFEADPEELTAEIVLQTSSGGFACEFSLYDEKKLRCKRGFLS